MFDPSCCFIGGNSFTLADFSTFFTGCTKWGTFWSSLFLMLCVQQAGILEHWWSNHVLYELRWHFYNVVVLFCAALQTSHQLTPRQETRNLTCHWSMKMSVNSSAHSSVSVGKHPAHSRWHQGRHSAWAAARKCKDSFSRPGSVGAAHSLWYICKLINCLPWPPATIPPANNRHFPL